MRQRQIYSQTQCLDAEGSPRASLWHQSATQSDADFNYLSRRVCFWHVLLRDSVSDARSLVFDATSHGLPASEVDLQPETSVPCFGELVRDPQHLRAARPQTRPRQLRACISGNDMSVNHSALQPQRAAQPPNVSSSRPRTAALRP